MFQIFKWVTNWICGKFRKLEIARIIGTKVYEPEHYQQIKNQHHKLFLEKYLDITLQTILGMHASFNPIDFKVVSGWDVLS